MSIDTNLDVLRRQIKDCEYDFMNKNGRAITKEDIKKNPKILKLYKVYRALKSKVSKLHSSHKGPTRPKEAQAVSTETKQSRNVALDPIEVIIREENESEEEVVVNMNTELGPTPQGNGKILSIFDLKLANPESSPLKSKSMPSPQRTDNISSPQKVEFKTPTKPKIVQPFTPIQSSGSRMLFMQRISAAMESPTAPSVYENVIQTPQYLRKNISKFDFNKTSSALSSPASSPIKKVCMTPEASTVQHVDFKVSPSPFKLHRHSLGHLVEVFQEHKKLQISKAELEEFGSNASSSSEDEDVSALPTKKRSKTQKRTTRNWKMRPNIVQENDNDLSKQNLHKVIENIEQKNQQKLQDDMEGISDSNEDEKEQTKPSTSGGRKIAPISRNYKRLKINNKSKFKKFRRR